MPHSFLSSVCANACTANGLFTYNSHLQLARQQIGALGLLLAFALPSPLAAEGRLSTFDEIAEIVESQFFDPSMNGLDWDNHIAAYRSGVQPDMSKDAFANLANEMLSALEASHTQLYVRDSPLWYQLAGVFLPRYDALRDALDPYLIDGAPIYTGIGVLLETRAEGDFVIGVLDGHPAEAAGVLLGDRIVTVDDQPFHPIRSFEGRAGQPTRLVVERHPGDLRLIEVVPALLNASTMFEDAMTASIRLIETDGIRIGYVHAWSYAGQNYQDIVTGALLYGELSNAQALVLDLRGGWGGANSSFLNLFFAHSIQTTSTSRDGEAHSFTSAWTRPVVLLVDEGTRSGKEVLAQGFRTLGRGLIVGERTAGAVLAGRVNALSDGSLLYVAAADIDIDGVRLEGRGVEPDTIVPFDPAFAAGSDPQFDQAIRETTTFVRELGAGEP